MENSSKLPDLSQSEIEAGINRAYGGGWHFKTFAKNGNNLYITLERGINAVKQQIAIRREDGHWYGPKEVQPLSEFDKKYNRVKRKAKVDNTRTKVSGLLNYKKKG